MSGCSPMKRAADADLLDTSDLDIDAALAAALVLVTPQVEKALQAVLSGSGAFDQRTLQLLRNLGGHDAAQLSPAGSTLVMDWHHEEGHRHRPARPKKS